MLLKHRPPGIDSQPVTPRAGFEHLESKSLTVLRWLNANKVDYVVVGSVARAIRGDHGTTGPVAIVPAPYDRNYERLCQALVSQHAGLRASTGQHGLNTRPAAAPIKLTADKLARGRRWLLTLGEYDLDVEGLADPSPQQSSPDQRGRPHYQELLYEAGRFEPADDLKVEVASLEDLELYSHVRRTGAAPEFKLTRKTPAEHETA